MTIAMARRWGTGIDMQTAERKSAESDRYCICPYCEEIFTLAGKIFQHKGGMVRCGVCEGVFDANQSLVIRYGDDLIAVGDEYRRTGFGSLRDRFKPGFKLPAEQKPETVAQGADTAISPHERSYNAQISMQLDSVGHVSEMDDEEDLEPTLNSETGEAVEPVVEPIIAGNKNGSAPLNSLGYRRAKNDFGERPNPFVTALWLVVACGFLLLLGLQVRTSFVPQYAQDEQYRDYLALFCRVAACELPPRVDHTGFNLTNTRIELHPTEPGALRVMVNLVNVADFAQPYPVLQLTLTDRVGRVVGRRTFASDFYLAPGETDMLQQGQPAAVHFDLARPHEQAVGFVVDVVTARS